MCSMISRVHIWLSLVSPELNMAVKMRKAVNYLSCPGHLGLIVIEVIV